MSSVARQNNRSSRAAFVSALVIYSVMIGINFDPAVTKAQIGVAGNDPLGIPARIFFVGLIAILFSPIFLWTPQLVKLHLYASQKETNFSRMILSSIASSIFSLFGLISLLTSVDDNTPKEIRKARNIVGIGLLYFVTLVVLWIVLAAMNGV